MSAPYTVTLADRAGPAGSASFESFEEALAVLRAWSVVPGIWASMHADGAEADGEVWHDGLTEEERDQL